MKGRSERDRDRSWGRVARRSGCRLRPPIVPFAAPRRESTPRPPRTRAGCSPEVATTPQCRRSRPRFPRGVRWMPALPRGAFAARCYRGSPLAKVPIRGVGQRDWRRRRCTSELERGSSDLSQHVARKWKRESSEATQTRENLVERLVAGQAGKHDMSRYDAIFVGGGRLRRHEITLRPLVARLDPPTSSRDNTPDRAACAPPLVSGKPVRCVRGLTGKSPEVRGVHMRRVVKVVAITVGCGVAASPTRDPAPKHPHGCPLRPRRISTASRTANAARRPPATYAAPSMPAATPTANAASVVMSRRVAGTRSGSATP